MAQYWSLIIVGICAIALAVLYIRKFYAMPSDSQIAKIKEYLLYCVILAEKEFKNGTGSLKLRYVYSLFIDKYSDIANVISFELFSTWVDEVLEQMRHILETNKDIATYVEGK